MKSFLDACRLVEPLQLVVEATGEPDVGVRVLHQPFALIGRDPRSDVPLEHRLVSRRHAYLQVVEGFVFWIDLESRLGTQGGGRPRKYGWLTREEPMRIGPYELRLGSSSRPTGDEPTPPEVFPLASRSYGSTTWPEVGLEFLNGPSRSAVWPMNRVVSLVGSAAGCKFRLADPSVSQFHCSLVRTAAGVWVVDLLGGNIEVNNAAVRYALLAEGDILTVGRYRIRIRSRSAEAAHQGTDGGTLALTRKPVPAAGTDLVPAVREADSGANMPVVPSVSILPAQVEAAAGTDPMAVLVPLMNQFGMMQQQMMDQFQNAMGMLVEMFGSLQREQMDVIRQELDQLREVTREVQELKAELASYARDRESAQASAAAPTPAVDTPPRSVPSVPVAASLDPSAPATHGDASAPADAAARGPARPGARQRPERVAPEAKDADVMLWLNNRISSLQQERETRWQKILKLLPGSS